MLFVLPAVLMVGFVLIALWWLCFGAALRQEWAVREAKRREANFERLLTVANEPLYCVSCAEIFAGPLPADGCPRCHIRALVIPACTSADSKVVEQGKQFTSTLREKEQAAMAAEQQLHATPEAATPSPEILPQGQLKK